MSFGEEIIPELEIAWENSFDSIIQGRIEQIIHTIQFDVIKKMLQDWAAPGNQDLLEGALIMARYQYPDLDEEKIRKLFDQIRQDVWLELNNNLTALEKVRVLNHILFEVHGFSGNTTNYHAPQNSYLNNVLESRKGNPLSLSIVYLIVARDLGIPIHGVNLPEHFVLAYLDNHENYPVERENIDTVLFYINPFSKGTVFSKKEIDAFLRQLKLDPEERFYMPCSNLDIIRRLLNNLIQSYEKLGYPSKTGELKELLKSLPEQE
jgi:regulator of sirC expression with transglutaminase-like and TPR domain